MNKQKLIRKYEDACFAVVPVDEVLEDLQQLDEPQAGHAEEAPRYLKNILARLRELPLHNREVWLKAIMSEFERDFSHAKWREGYKQGKFEAMFGCEKIVVPQFVADWYEEHKDSLNYSIWQYVYNWHDQEETEFKRWFACSKNSFETLIGMSHYGYEVEKEKRYLVKLKGVNGRSRILKHNTQTDVWYMGGYAVFDDVKIQHTKKELEDAGFGWVFDCPGVEVQAVE